MVHRMRQRSRETQHALGGDWIIPLSEMERGGESNWLKQSLVRWSVHLSTEEQCPRPLSRGGAQGPVRGHRPHVPQGCRRPRGAAPLRAHRSVRGAGALAGAALSAPPRPPACLCPCAPESNPGLGCGGESTLK